MLIRIAIVEDQEKTLESLTILLNNAETLRVAGGFIFGRMGRGRYMQEPG